jgi:hypothetical protein
MYARTVDDAAARLRELRQEEREALALGALALGLAVAASEITPALALPLLLGGLFVGALGLQALWRRWDLVDRLSGDRDAYAIPEVLTYASLHTSMESRHGSAQAIRRFLHQPSFYEPTPAAVARELEALACELDDAALTLASDRAVACSKMLDELFERRALNTVTWADVRSEALRIRSGFRPRS